MDDAVVVGVVERAADLAAVLGDLLEGEHALRRLQDVRQALAGQELHGEEGRVAFLADVEDGDDVGMRERARRLELALEPGLQLVELGLLEAGLGPHHLDRDLPSDDRILGQVHHSHAAAAERSNHAEPAEGLRRVRS